MAFNMANHCPRCGKILDTASMTCKCMSYPSQQQIQYITAGVEDGLSPVALEMLAMHVAINKRDVLIKQMRDWMNARTQAHYTFYGDAAGIAEEAQCLIFMADELVRKG